MKLLFESKHVDIDISMNQAGAVLVVVMFLVGVIVGMMV
jgi:hypothetical protein